MATTEIDQINPSGDVIVEVGDRRVRVSSTVMRLASPVFGAMFNSGFTETVNSETSTATPSIVRLPEDDGEVFVVFASTVHLQSGVDSKVDADFLNQLGVFCDKYRCTRSVCFSAEAQLAQLSQTTSQSTPFELLCAAYMLDNPRFFNIISQKMLLSHAASFEPGYPNKCQESDLQILLCNLNEQREQTLKTLETSIMDPIWKLTSLNCPEAFFIVGQYKYDLKRTDLLPTGSALISKSLTDIVTRFAPSALDRRVTDLGCGFDWRCICHKWKRPGTMEAVKTQLSKTGQRHGRLVSGLHQDGQAIEV